MKNHPRTSIGFVSTYPPTVCGIATYTASLVEGIAGHRNHGRGVGVVSLTDRGVGVAGEPVVLHHRVGDPASLAATIRTLNTYDTVSIQHEFGIYGGPDGEEVIDLMAGLRVPMAVTLHTVLDDPTDHQRTIIQEVCRLADRVVVMSETAAIRLPSRYGVDPERISIIPHGVDREFARPPRTDAGRPLILTWGLIGPGKGLEWAIEAMVGLVDTDPLPHYLILGSTHPQVRHKSGESYRQGLMSLAKRLGVDHMVEFDDRYLERRALARMVRSADVVVVPYESMEQVTSGVLVEAIAAAKPVVATPFPHAVELLSNGAGMIVPYAAPEALGSALRDLLADPQARERMTRRSLVLAADWYWPAVARRFNELMAGLTTSGSSERRLTGIEQLAG